MVAVVAVAVVVTVVVVVGIVVLQRLQQQLLFFDPVSLVPEILLPPSRPHPRRLVRRHVVTVTTHQHQG